MRQLFVSYARENRAQVDELVNDLEALGNEPWVDSHLRGGQTWWEEILDRIKSCDVFVAIVSRRTLTSVACQREMQWAVDLGKPLLPIAIEDIPGALPRDLSMRQIVNYTQPGRQAMRELAAAMSVLKDPPALPNPLPPPPSAPLSYLSDLTKAVSQHDPRLSFERQHEILTQLQPALNSDDTEERASGRYILDLFSKRPDLYADVNARITQMLGQADRPTEKTDQKAPPGWYPDPSGKHEWRWFEGDWTDHVSDRGIESKDPC